MCCSANGSIGSRSLAWLPAPPQYFWSTKARACEKLAPCGNPAGPAGSHLGKYAKASVLSSGGFARRALRSALCLLRLLFLLGGFLRVFLAALLGRFFRG